MSCIYGPHQCGTEDQGWVAHFLIKALEGQTITVYGDGMQVRDVLFVEDLVDAFLRAQANMGSISGQAFNIGGGPSNTTSLMELLDHIETLHGERPEVEFDEWRAADQRYYVSDTRRFRSATGWQAKTSVAGGLDALYRWLQESRTRVPMQLAEEHGGIMKIALVNPPWSLRGQHLLRLSRAAPAARVRLRPGAARSRRPPGDAARRAARWLDAASHARRPRGLAARTDGRHHGAELPVLAVRASRVARSAGND